MSYLPRRTGATSREKRFSSGATERAAVDSIAR
jgi:hypothetical protein